MTTAIVETLTCIVDAIEVIVTFLAQRAAALRMRSSVHGCRFFAGVGTLEAGRE